MTKKLACLEVLFNKEIHVYENGEPCYPEIECSIVSKPTYCCENLENCSSISFFTSKYSLSSDPQGIWKENNFALGITDRVYDGDTDYIPISFCPFCGIPIHLKLNKVVKVIHKKKKVSKIVEEFEEVRITQ